MKLLLLLITSIVFHSVSLKTFAQESTEYSGKYKWTEEIIMMRCDLEGNPIDGKFESSRANQSFIVIRESGEDSVIIKILDYTMLPMREKAVLKKNRVLLNFDVPIETISTSVNRTQAPLAGQYTILSDKIVTTGDTWEKYTIAEYYDSLENEFVRKDTIQFLSGKNELVTVDGTGYDFVPQGSFYKYNFSGSEVDFHSLPNSQRNARNYEDHQIYFIVSKTQIDKKTYYKQGASLDFGFINFPFKARFTPLSDFSGSFNLGTAVGLTIAHKSYRKWKFSIITGQSISNIRLDKASVVKNADLLVDNNDFSALTLSIGPMLSNNKVQIGLFVGMDMLSRQNQSTYNWIYNKEPWFSVGIGFSIFSTEGQRRDNGDQAIQKN